MRRAQCGACSSTILRPILDLGDSPLADAFPASPDDPEDRYPLVLLVCERCWLVQLADIVPDDDLYNADYGFYTGTSPSLVAYFEDFARWVGTWSAPRLTVEIACNDGTLLRGLPGERRIGVEPSANVAQAARDSGLEVIVAPFTEAVARDIVSSDGTADLVVACNVIAHVSDLEDVLGGIEILLSPEGHAVIEVQYVGDLLTGNQFDHVYHEHRYYFGYGPLSAALGRHGLVIERWRYTPAQGGSLRVVAGRGVPAVGPDEAWLHTASAYGLQGRVDHIRERLVDLLAAQPGVVAGYAASAKSTTLLNSCGIGPDMVRWVEDTTPHKVGRYTPGTHIPIVGPDHERPDTFLLMAWNHLPGVMRRERAFLDAGGRFIVPIPQPVVL